MNIYELRNSIEVTGYYSFSNCCVIYYQCAALYSGSKTLLLSANDFLSELVLIGSVDDEFTIDELEAYSVSQWDALNMVIRHELKIAQDKEIENSDISKALDNLLNSNK